MHEFLREILTGIVCEKKYLPENFPEYDRETVCRAFRALHEEGYIRAVLKMSTDEHIRCVGAAVIDVPAKGLLEINNWPS